MFKFLMLVVLLVLSEGKAVLKLPDLESRIVGGSIADITEAPYTVALLLDIYQIGIFNHWCGGSIISPWIIVTAAHCIDNISPSKFRIRAGSTYNNIGGQVLKVSMSLRHEDFDYIRFRNDVGILSLATSLVFNENISSVVLPNINLIVADGTDALITGWGTLIEGGGSTNILHKVTIQTINLELCREAYNTINMNVADSMICAGNLGTGGKDACSGDSGGPMVIQDVLVGISSWGRGCASAYYPGVWTRVSSVRDWIDLYSSILTPQNKS